MHSFKASFLYKVKGDNKYKIWLVAFCKENWKNFTVEEAFKTSGKLRHNSSSLTKNLGKKNFDRNILFYFNFLKTITNK